jgi:hypothetical protein
VIVTPLCWTSTVSLFIHNRTEFVLLRGEPLAGKWQENRPVFKKPFLFRFQ